MKMFSGVRKRLFVGILAPAATPAPNVRSDFGQVVSRGSKENGQTLIEFAFIMPLLLLFILLVVDFGIALDRRELIQHAVREGARRGAVGETVAQITDQIHDQSKGTLDAGDITVCYVDKNGDGRRGDPGDNVQVSGSYTYKFTVGGGEMLSMFGVGAPSIDMSPSAEERLEKSPPNPIPC